jgi:oligopeptide transport system substrate-binding protein
LLPVTKSSSAQPLPPTRNIFRYVTGDEPSSLDPAISNGQPEARIYMALYEGLVEYNPKTLEPDPALAERWHINNDSSEFTFHLRTNGRWSNGDPIDANDFVYSFRRAIDKKTGLSQCFARLIFEIRAGLQRAAVFVRDPQTGQFLLAEISRRTRPEPIAAARSIRQRASIFRSKREDSRSGHAFHHQMHTPLRLTLPAMRSRAQSSTQIRS